MTARRFASCAETFGESPGPVDGIAAEPVYLDVSVPPGRRRTLPVETTRHAFAYVFSGAGKFCNASGSAGGADRRRRLAGYDAPPSEADNRSLVLFDRGDEVEVQAGRGRDPVPAGFGQAAGGAGGVVRPDRDEYAAAVAAGVRGTGAGNVLEGEGQIGSVRFAPCSYSLASARTHNCRYSCDDVGWTVGRHESLPSPPGSAFSVSVRFGSFASGATRPVRAMSDLLTRLGPRTPTMASHLGRDCSSIWKKTGGVELHVA